MYSLKAQTTHSCPILYRRPISQCSKCWSIEICSRNSNKRPHVLDIKFYFSLSLRLITTTRQGITTSSASTANVYILCLNFGYVDWTFTTVNTSVFLLNLWSCVCGRIIQNLIMFVFVRTLRKKYYYMTEEVFFLWCQRNW